MSSTSSNLILFFAGTANWFTDNGLYPHKNKGGRPSISKEPEELILRLARENPRWGYGKIQGEIIKLSFKVSQPTVRNILDLASSPCLFAMVPLDGVIL